MNYLVFSSGISSSTYLQKAGVLETGCLHNMTANNTVSDFMFTPEEEKSFLLELYRQTGGFHWHNQSGWKDSSQNHHCTWYGIQCYENNSYVKSIDLTGNMVQYQPPNFWRFRNLQCLCLTRNNGLYGQISDIISVNMTRLRRVSLSFTGVYGKVPWDLILELYNLEKLQLCCMTSKWKRLSGELPRDIGRLSKLQVLSLGENNISNTDLPKSIGNLVKLWFLDLEYVKLRSGDLTYFQNMTHLQKLHLTNCGLNGTIPDDFGRTHTKLIQFHLYGNHLSGELGTCFSGLKIIKQIVLGSNRLLTGKLPRSLGGLHTLEVLDLSRNNFTGMEENFTFGKQLQNLYIHENVNFNAEGKAILQALQPSRNQLRLLIAHNAGLKGSLPIKFWNFPKVMYIDLSNNTLTGAVPSYIMASLFYLKLASNNFTGSLSKLFLSSLKTLTYLNLQGNDLMTSKRVVTQWEYFKPSFKETIPRGHYTCPTFILTTTGGKVELDPAYYDYSECFCANGFYGFKKFCKPCMEGGWCKVFTPPNKPLVGGNNLNMTIKKGYWPCCDGFSNVTRMVKCSGHEKVFDEEICNPSGKCQCKLTLVNGRPQTVCDKSCICLHGNEGRFCSKCITGYYKIGSICKRCPKFFSNFPVSLTVAFFPAFLIVIGLIVLYRYFKTLTLVLSFLFSVALVVLHGLQVVTGWFYAILASIWILAIFLSGSSDGLESFLYIAVFYFQSLDAMFTDANVWPRKIASLKYQITRIFNFDLDDLVCHFENVNRPEWNFAITLSVPVGIVLVIWCSYVFVKVVCSFRRISYLKSTTCKYLTVQVILFFYFPISEKTLYASWPCEHRDGLMYLKMKPWLDCHGFSFDCLRILGYCSLVVFVISVPFFVFLPLLWGNVDKDGKYDKNSHVWLKPLYEEFKPKYRRYFPLLYLLRRLVLAILLTVVKTTSSAQIILVTLLLLMFIVINLICHPYKQYSNKFEFETLADVVVCAVLLLSFISLALLRVSKYHDESFVWFIVFTNGIVVVACCAGIFLLLLVNLCSPNEPINVYELQQK